MKVAIYCRVSTQEQNPDMQLTALERKLKHTKILKEK